MEFQKLVLVVLEKLKVDFQRAQSVFASCTWVDKKSGNHNIRGMVFDFCNRTMRFDIGAKALFKLFAELDECLLQVGNSIEYIETKRISFCLALSRFVVQQDKISYCNWTLSRTAPATIKSFNTNNQKLRKSSLQSSTLASTSGATAIFPGRRFE